jgi:RNA polymerase sigma factor (sigma-70 family)
MASAESRAGTDAELVVDALRGSKEAFAALVSRHRPMACALVRRLLADEMLAAGAVQEATVAALVGLRRLRSPEHFGAWYAGIALNTARHFLRQPSASLLPAEEVTDESPGPEEQAAASVVVAEVRVAVASLPPGQRSAVLAFYWAGLTHAEAALELGITQGAVKARLHQARARLAPCLDQLVHDREEVTAMSTAESRWVDVEIVEVRRSEGSDPLRRYHVVVLQERGGTRRLPIYTGSPEAMALAFNLESVEMPRPMTYQFAANLLMAGGSQIKEVRVTRLAESTFYAIVMVDTPSGSAEVDCRPSDALNIALVTGAPIRIDIGLLDDSGDAWCAAWERYPTRASELVSEAQQQQAEMMSILAEER